MELAENLFEQACLEEDRDLELAAHLYEQVLAQDMLHVDAHVNLGRIRQEQRRSEDAERHYRFALFIRPDDATAAYNLATVLEDLGQDDEAIRQYRAVLAASPELADAHFNLSRLLEREGEVQAAFRHLKEYRQLWLASGGATSLGTTSH